MTEMNRAPGHDGVIGPDETDPDRRDLRSEIGKYVSLEGFPATGDDLCRAAAAAGAPDTVVGELRKLPPQTSYANTAELWQALGLETRTRF